MGEVLTLEMFEEGLHRLLGALVAYALPRGVARVVFVQTFLNTRFCPIGERLERSYEWLTAELCGFVENGPGLFAGSLPGAVPYQPSLCDVPCELVFLKCKVQDIIFGDDARLE